MLFTSLTFLFFFLPAVILLYYICSFSRQLQNILLFVVSILFYAWGQLEFVPILIASIIINTLIGYAVSIKRRNQSLRKGVLIIGIILNVGLLVFYKYLGFAIETLTTIGFEHIEKVNIVLPIGISFFTFQSISYIVDVYKGKAEVVKNPFIVGLYISFFPTLLAGPIVRFSTIREQLYQRKSNLNKFSVGCCRFIVGLAKKMILSGCIAVVADYAFEMNAVGELSFVMAWLGIISYILQLYYDFSGYSDMAIGLGMMFGFKIEENFNYPYIATSISEFWRRWHISLSAWFKEYIYFPLGGSHVKNNDIMIRNLFIVWTLTGIWHGASWNFVYWGIFNFVFIFMERLLKFDSLSIPKFFKHFYLILVILIGFVLFRSTDLQQAGLYYRSMMNIKTSLCDASVLFFLKEYAVYLIIAIVFCTPITKVCNHYLAMFKEKLSFTINIVYPIAMMMLFILTLTYVMKGSYTSFIYFNF